MELLLPCKKNELKIDRESQESWAGDILSEVAPPDPVMAESISRNRKELLAEQRSFPDKLRSFFF